MKFSDHQQPWRRLLQTFLSVVLCCFFFVTASDGHPGREFVVGFLQNRPIYNYPDARIYITTLSLRTVTVTIRVPGTESGRLWAPSESEEASGYHGEYKKRLTVTALRPAVHEIPTEIHFEGLNLEDKGVHITSTADITVQVASVNERSSDMYLALPINTWDTEYYVLSTLFRGKAKLRQGPSQFAVIAANDDTEVTITVPDKTRLSGSVGPDVETDGRYFKITMHSYQTFQLRSDSDLTGARIFSLKPVTVIAGSEWTSVGKHEENGDYMVEQLPPVSAWSNMYLTSPLATMVNGDSFRILSARDDTNITIIWYGGSRARNRTITLHEGYFYDLKASHTEYIHIRSSSAPVLVAQFCNSLGPDATIPGDPFMMLVQPMSQYFNHYTFWTMTSQSVPDTYHHYLNVLIHGNADPQDFLLDGKYLTDEVIHNHWTKIPNSSYWSLTLKLKSGGHRLSQKDGIPFSATVYGFSEREGYGSPVGLISPEPWEEAESIWEWAVGNTLPTSSTPSVSESPVSSTLPGLQSSTTTSTVGPQPGGGSTSINSGVSTLSNSSSSLVTSTPFSDLPSSHSSGLSANTSVVDGVLSTRTSPFSSSSPHSGSNSTHIIVNQTEPSDVGSNSSFPFSSVTPLMEASSSLPVHPNSSTVDGHANVTFSYTDSIQPNSTLVDDILNIENSSVPYTTTSLPDGSNFSRSDDSESSFVNVTNHSNEVSSSTTTALPVIQTVFVCSEYANVSLDVPIVPDWSNSTTVPFENNSTITNSSSVMNSTGPACLQWTAINITLTINPQEESSTDHYSPDFQSTESSNYLNSTSVDLISYDDKDNSTNPWVTDSVHTIDQNLTLGSENPEDTANTSPLSDVSRDNTFTDSYNGSNTSNENSTSYPTNANTDSSNDTSAYNSSASLNSNAPPNTATTPFSTLSGGGPEASSIPDGHFSSTTASETSQQTTANNAGNGGGSGGNGGGDGDNGGGSGDNGGGSGDNGGGSGDNGGGGDGNSGGSGGNGGGSGDNGGGGDGNGGGSGGNGGGSGDNGGGGDGNGGGSGGNDGGSGDNGGGTGGNGDSTISATSNTETTLQPQTEDKTSEASTLTTRSTPLNTSISTYLSTTTVKSTLSSTPSTTQQLTTPTTKSTALSSIVSTQTATSTVKSTTTLFSTTSNPISRTQPTISISSPPITPSISTTDPQQPSTTTVNSTLILPPASAPAKSTNEEKEGLDLKVVIIPVCIVILCPLLCILGCYGYNACARRVLKKNRERILQKEQMRLDQRNKYSFRPPTEEEGKPKKYADPDLERDMTPVQVNGSVHSFGRLEAYHLVDEREDKLLVPKNVRRSVRRVDEVHPKEPGKPTPVVHPAKKGPVSQTKSSAVSSKPPRPPMRRTSTISYKQVHPVPTVKRLPSDSRLKSREKVTIKEPIDVSKNKEVETKAGKRMKLKRKIKKSSKVNVFKCHQIPVPPQTDSSSSGYHSGFHNSDGLPQSQTGSSSNLDSSHHSESLALQKRDSVTKAVIATSSNPLFNSLQSSPRQHMVAMQLSKSMTKHSFNKVHPVDYHTVISNTAVTVLNGSRLKRLARVQTPNDTQGYEASEEDSAI